MEATGFFTGFFFAAGFCAGAFFSVGSFLITGFFAVGFFIAGGFGAFAKLKDAIKISLMNSFVKDSAIGSWYQSLPFGNVDLPNSGHSFASLADVSSGSKAIKIMPRSVPYRNANVFDLYFKLDGWRGQSKRSRISSVGSLTWRMSARMSIRVTPFTWVGSVDVTATGVTIGVGTGLST